MIYFEGITGIRQFFFRLLLRMLQTQNHTPQIINITANPPILGPFSTYEGGTSVIKVIAVDIDGDSLTYTWTSPEGWFLNRSGESWSQNEQGYRLYYDDLNGEYVVTCWVSDGKSAVSDTVIVIKR